MPDNDIFLVFVSAKSGHEEDYARWFCDEHMDDMRRLAGVRFAFCGHLTSLDGEPSPSQLCGFYETPDTVELLKTIAASKGTPALPVSDLQGAMVWRVLDTVAVYSERGASASDDGVLLCLFEQEPADAEQIASLPVAQARLTRIGAAQPARGREYASVVFLTLRPDTDPAALAASIAARFAGNTVRFLLVSPS